MPVTQDTGHGDGSNMEDRMICTRYGKIRRKMRAGDVIAFGGTGWISRLIKAFTRSRVSHVGVILEINEHGRIMVMESTTLHGNKKGVQINRLSRRIQHYKGDVWWLPLSHQVREAADMAAFWHFLWDQDGKKYDTWQAIKSALPSFIHREHFDKIFCSELVAGAAEAAGMIPKINASEATPADVVNFSIYHKNYFQLMGDKTEIY